MRKGSFGIYLVCVCALALPCDAACHGEIVGWGYDNSGQVSSAPTESNFVQLAGGGTIFPRSVQHRKGRTSWRSQVASIIALP